MICWAIKDSDGRVRRDFVGSSRIEVGCKVMPARYDAFRLHVSASYRELFDRALQRVLEHNGWRIVQIKRGRPSKGEPREHEVPLTHVKAQAPGSGQHMFAPHSGLA